MSPHLSTFPTCIVAVPRPYANAISQEKFTERYEASEAHVTATLRDLPPVAGKILWARQIERQLRLLMQRMEDVLGAG